MTEYYESYIGTSEQERLSMLKEMGINDVDELFSDIPKELMLKEPIPIEGPFSEGELTRIFAKIAAKNINPNTTSSFLGGGVKHQYIPAAIEELMRRGELYTAYTPYQPEVSQGMLQLIYEYQSQLAELLDMEVVNASMYDWGSALGEVILIMHRITKKRKVILAGPISPNRLEVANSYIAYSNIEIELLEPKDGKVDIDKLKEIFSNENEKDKKERNLMGIYFEVPSYFGTISEYPEDLIEIIHKSKSLVSVGVDPLSLGILSPPGEYNVDFVIGEGQLLGNAVSNGGPLLGIIATNFNRKWIRELPGRLIGATTELSSDTPGYCITLQTREQHIRRDKATSNICTNQSIAAVNASIYMASLGPQGIIELSSSFYDKAHYLAEKLGHIEGVNAPLYSPFFSEFVIKVDNIDHDSLEEYFLKNDIIPGLKIDGVDCLRLISVTETQTKSDLDNFVSLFEGLIL